MMLRAAGLCLLFLWHTELVCQEIKSVSLDEVTIYGSRISEGEVGVMSTTIDSLVLSQSQGENFAELIRKIGAGQIRSYGVSGLSTPAFRGTNGSQTSFLWNGITLNSSLNGSSDISQIPITGNEQIKIQKGGASSLYGSGAIGGTIQIDSRPSFQDNTRIQMTGEFGSFGRRLHQLHFGTSTMRKSFSMTLYNRVMENDYPYLNSYRRPARIETRNNARYYQQGITTDIDFRMGSNQVIGAKFWGQKNEYQVPNSILASSNASANQQDESLRGLVHWNYAGKSHAIVIKEAFVYNSLLFTDPSARIDSRTTFGAWTSRIESTWDMSKGVSLLLGLNHLFEYAGEENFGENAPERNTTSLFGSFKFRPAEKTSMALNVRQERPDGSWAPIAPSFGIEHQLSSLIGLSGNISRNYRIPTFNDLYWKGAGGFGNPLLLPESAWGGELSVHLLAKEQSVFQIQVTGYSQSVDNWILWRPVSAEGWSPDNVKKVWTRGGELDVLFEKKNGGVNIVTNSSYRFTRTTNEEISSENFIREKGKQLSYTPIHEFVQSLKVEFEKFAFLTRYNLVGKQFSEGENKDVFALPSYGIWDVSVEYRQRDKKNRTKIHLKADNILNTNYENRRGYPMYGRNYSLGVSIEIQSKQQ